MSKTPTQAEIRRQFLDFFVAREHREVPSGPVFPQDDPTLLFTNAGMNQFKDVFLATGQRPYVRAVDTQKCIRVSGKHNDLEEVGVDTYHHTFFEMLGNWSFGDYFKEEAIRWAWELLTEVWKLPKERLWVTVFAGDPELGLPPDEEAERIWLAQPGVSAERVLRFDKKDNFWEMGASGPCGPCSEIHIDRGGKGSDPADGADPAIGVNAGNERFIELWNLVFMEFNRLEDGSLETLPARHVDTGMGFERIVSVLQGKTSNYDTDVFSRIFARIGEVVGRTYGAGEERADVAFRVIADHVRAVSSAFADGALPSNLGRGYVLRRLIRRASRYGRQVLGVDDPFLFEVVPAVGEVLGEAFPEIARRLDHIQLLVQSEEEAFAKTLGRGLVRFEELAGRVRERGKSVLPGSEAYELYATFGFPRDLVELMARERSMEVDGAGWDEAQLAHVEASRARGKFRLALAPEQLAGLPPTISAVHEESGDAGVETRIAAHFPFEEQSDVLVLENSPFYAEAGGQIGDRGHVEALDGSFRFRVEDTQLVGEIVLHHGESEGVPSEGMPVRAVVDRERRERTRRHHTATHLLHAALREVLGEHVTQQGSYVGPDRLRFDLSHPRAIRPEELERIEARVNEEVCANRPVQTAVEELETARARGAMALFGEKYADRVRVVEVEGTSVELCGGTHVRATGDIGPFVIVSEGAIQAGVRRVEAFAGSQALEWIQERRRLLRETAQKLKSSPEELPERVDQLLTQVKQARKKASSSSQAEVEKVLEEVRGGLVERAGLLVGAFAAELDQKGLRELATRVKSLAGDLAVVLLGSQGPKVPWIAICQGAALERGLDARIAAGEVARHVGGGGGGRPELAQGQGSDAAGRQSLLEQHEKAPEGLFQAAASIDTAHEQG